MSNETPTAAASAFDGYAANYRDVVNRAIKRSGEEYEYFIDRRVLMMKLHLDQDSSLPRSCPRTILDFGCGTGVTESILRSYFPETSLFGVDISAESIQVAKKTDRSGAIFTIGNGKTLPYQDNKFDLIYMNGTMHHIHTEEHVGILQELKRVLAPGGLLYIFENNPRNPLMKQAMRYNPFDAGIDPIKPKELRNTSLAAGFKVAGTWYAFFFPRYLKVLRLWEARMEWIPFGAQYCICLTR